MNQTTKFALLLLISLSVVACSKKSDQPSGEAAQATAPSTVESGSSEPKLPTFSAYKESLQAAAAKGDHEAENLLANVQMAESGNKDAQAWLGVNYLSGSFFQHDNTEALKLLSSAANQNQQTAEYFLGVMYEHGESIPVDLEKAKLWYTKCTKGSNKEFADRCKQSLGFLAPKMTKK